MDDDEELRSQCFGGDNPTSTFDQPAVKRYVFLFEFSLKLSFLIDKDDGGTDIYYSMKKFMSMHQIQLSNLIRKYQISIYVCREYLNSYVYIIFVLYFQR